MQRNIKKTEDDSFSSIHQDAFKNIANNIEYNRDLRSLTQTNSTLFGRVKNALSTQNIFSFLNQDTFNIIASHLPYNRELANLSRSNPIVNELVKKTPAGQFAKSTEQNASYLSTLKELAAKHSNNHIYAYASIASLATIIAAQEMGVGISATIGVVGGGILGLSTHPEIKEFEYYYSESIINDVSKYCFSAAAFLSVFAAQNPALYNAIGIEGVLLTATWSLGIGSVVGAELAAYAFDTDYSIQGAGLFAAISAISTMVGIGSNMAKTACGIDSSSNLGMMIATGVSTAVCGLFYNSFKVASDAAEQKKIQQQNRELLNEPYNPFLLNTSGA